MFVPNKESFRTNIKSKEREKDTNRISATERSKIPSKNPLYWKWISNARKQGGFFFFGNRMRETFWRGKQTVDNEEPRI